MKKIAWASALLLSLASYSQKNDFTAHLDHPNEVGFNIVGTRNGSTTPGVYYERQINHNIGLGAIVGFSSEETNQNDDNTYSDSFWGNNGRETFNFNAYGRYYFKDYITQSFLYLFFDNNVKIRYFIEGTAGLSTLKNRFTERTKNANDIYVIQRNNHKFTDATLGLGYGIKLLAFERFSIEMYGGGGKYLFNKKQAEGYAYFNLGLGYRF